MPIPKFNDVKSETSLMTDYRFDDTAKNGGSMRPWPNNKYAITYAFNLVGVAG